MMKKREELELQTPLSLLLIPATMFIPLLSWFLSSLPPSSPLKQLGTKLKSRF